MDAEGRGGEDPAAEGEPMPAFVSYGIFMVVVYAVAIGALVGLSSVDVQGPSLVAFTVGFSVFVTVYLGSMWAGWLFFHQAEETGQRRGDGAK